MRKYIIISWLLISLFLFVQISVAVESDVDRLLELLVKKGVITQQDATEFRADLAVKKQEEKEQQKEFNITAGKQIKISGYTQLRYQNFEEEGKNDSFDIRRARLSIQGDLTERFDYRTQVEFGGTKGPFLLDAALGYKVNPYLKLTGGQFKIPFSQENLISSPKLETIDRSQVVEALVARSKDVLGNQNGRDIGVQASGSLLQRTDSYLIDYAIGLFDGAGINTADTNDQKDIIGRLVVHPLKDLSVGGSFYQGKYTLSSALAKKDARDRLGAEFAYIHAPVSFKGEYIRGKDGVTKKDGWYLQSGYFIIPKKLQGVFKYDTYDPNTNAKDDETSIYTFGGNWYFNQWAFLQLDYELKDERGKEVNNNSLIGQLTFQF